jgi:hypothetical protein
MFANVIGGQRDMAAELQAAGPVTSRGTRYGAAEPYGHSVQL